MRAIQVPVNEFDSSSIKSGDRVDVLVTGNATGSNDTQTKTVLLMCGCWQSGPEWSP
jgi:Flp pilus assembly protein CpaB